MTYRTLCHEIMTEYYMAVIKAFFFFIKLPMLLSSDYCAELVVTFYLHSPPTFPTLKERSTAATTLLKFDYTMSFVKKKTPFYICIYIKSADDCLH